MNSCDQKNTHIHSVLVLSERDCENIIDRTKAFQAVQDVFASMARGDAHNFPVIREAIGHADGLYGFKSGFDRASMVLGVKSGGYWPNNFKKNLTNHQSIISLFDPDTGLLTSIIGGNYLTAVRTAASSAISISYLARKEASVLGILGAGHQSTYQLRAALEQREFKKVMAWNLHPENLTRLAEVCKEMGLPFQAVECKKLASESDVIITITSAFEALLMKDWIKPGCHIACMGTDTVGKQEVDPALLAMACVFTDEIAQSITIGEAQHAINARLIQESDITPIGQVINGNHQGRRNETDVTLFDGTGVGLQDLAVASAAADLAKTKCLGKRVAL